VPSFVLFCVVANSFSAVAILVLVRPRSAQHIPSAAAYTSLSTMVAQSKPMKAMKTTTARTVMKKPSAADPPMKAKKEMKAMKKAAADPPRQKDDVFIVQIVGCPTRGNTKVVCSLTDTVGAVCSRLEVLWGTPDIELTLLGAADSLSLPPIAVIGDLGIKLSRRLFSRETTPKAAASTASSTAAAATKATEVIKKPALSPKAGKKDAADYMNLTMVGGGRMEQFTLNVKASNTILMLKTAVTEATGLVPMDPNWMLWSPSSQLMCDRHTIGSYLQDGDVVYIGEADIGEEDE
jgi:hypothetical protein